MIQLMTRFIGAARPGFTGQTRMELSWRLFQVHVRLSLNCILDFRVHFAKVCTKAFALFVQIRACKA